MRKLLFCHHSIRMEQSVAGFAGKRISYGTVALVQRKKYNVLHMTKDENEE